MRSLDVVLLCAIWYQVGLATLLVNAWDADRKGFVVDLNPIRIPIISLLGPILVLITIVFRIWFWYDKRKYFKNK